MNQVPKAKEQQTDTTDASLDVRLKHAQLEKIAREIRELDRSRWSFESVSKVMVAALAVTVAAFAVYAGIPQAKLELYDAQTRLSTARGEFAEAQMKVASTNADLQRAQKELSMAREETAKINKDADLDLQTISAARAAEVERLQGLLATVQPQNAALQRQITSASKPRVFIQFAGTLPRSYIDQLRKALDGEGFSAPEGERINRGQKNEVRYFTNTASERQRAERVSTVTQNVFREANCPIGSIAVRHVTLSESQQSPLELWLLHNCKPN